jgi:hypothetical protein
MPTPQQVKEYQYRLKRKFRAEHAEELTRYKESIARHINANSSIICQRILEEEPYVYIIPESIRHKPVMVADVAKLLVYKMREHYPEWDITCKLFQGPHAHNLSEIHVYFKMPWKTRFVLTIKSLFDCWRD